MARPPARCSSRQNSSPTGKNGVARAGPGPALTRGSNTSTPAPILSCILIFALTVAPVVASGPALALAVVPTTALSSDNNLFKQFMKAYLNA